jgi:hypothetical protein
MNLIGAIYVIAVNVFLLHYYGISTLATQLLLVQCTLYKSHHKPKIKYILFIF